jgi:hypothetical protein
LKSEDYFSKFLDELDDIENVLSSCQGWPPEKLELLAKRARLWAKWAGARGPGRPKGSLEDTAYHKEVRYIGSLLYNARLQHREQHPDDPGETWTADKTMALVLSSPLLNEWTQGGKDEKKMDSACEAVRKWSQEKNVGRSRQHELLWLMERMAKDPGN